MSVTRPTLIALLSLLATGCSGFHRTHRSLDTLFDSTHSDPECVTDACRSLQCVASEEADSKFRQIRTGSSPKGLLGGFDWMSPMSLPVTALMEFGRFFVLEDADSFFQSTSFDNYILWKDSAPKINPQDTIEISVRMIAIDNFVEGRLRDAWGGNGGEVSFQASVNALSPSGRLLREDRKFLVTEEIKRRSPVLAALRATQKGREVVGKLEDQARGLLDKVDAAGKKVRDTIQDLITQASAVIQPGDLATLKQDLKQKIRQILASLNLDSAEREILEFLEESLAVKIDEF